MSSGVRRASFLIAAAAMLGFLCWGFGGLSNFGHYPGPYGDVLNQVAVPERHVLNVVTSVIFDYRGFDTLGEEFILFASVCGVVVLLRDEEARQRKCDYIPWDTTAAVSLFGFGFVGLLFVFAIYMTITSHLSLGGGFQGGAALAGVWGLVFVAFGARAVRKLASRRWAEFFEAVGASGYAVIGFCAMFAGKPFLTNIVPLGKTGDLFSSGTIWLINFFVGIEVTAGFILLFLEFILPLVQVKEQRTG